MESIYCPVCGEEQNIPESSDSFLCAQCGSVHLISTDGKLRSIRFEAGHVVREDTWLKKWTARVRGLLSNQTSSTTEDTEETEEETRQEKLLNTGLIVLSTAVVISLVFLSIIIIRETQAKRTIPPPSSTLASLPEYDPDIYQTPSKTAIPTWTITPTIVLTPTPTPIFGVVKSLTLNLRAGPGTGYNILKKLQMDDIVILVARNDQNNWVMIKTGNDELGWVSTSLIDHDYDLSKLGVVYEVFTIPVTGATQIAANTLAATSTLGPAGTLAPTGTNEPTLTQTPFVTQTPTPYRVARPPEGGWCEENTVRGICIHRIDYFIETINNPSGPISIQFAVVDAFIENRSAYDILIDPYNFTLILEDGSFSFFFDDLEELFEDVDEITFTSIVPGGSILGTLRFSMPENTIPETLIYQGYLYESMISIDFNDVP